MAVNRVRSKLQVELMVRASLRTISPKNLLACSAKMGALLGLAGRLNLLLTGSREIRRLNRQYLKHDRPTDVIAFGYTESRRSPRFRMPRSKKDHQDAALVGEIAISLPVTARQAIRYGNTFFYELCFYICHGMLHLQGWEDRTPGLRNRMLKKQEEILKQIGVIHQI